MVAIPRYFANIQKARRAEAVSTLSSIRDALMCYYSVNNDFPAVDSFPIAVNLENDTVLFMDRPVSTGFSYSYDATHVIATLIAGSSDTSYTMNLSSGSVTP